MKNSIATIILAASLSAQADNGFNVTTNQGSYQVQQSGSTTYVTQTARGSSTSSASGIGVAVPVTVNPVTGLGMVQGPNGSYVVQRSGSTTTVIQTSKGR